MIQTILEKVITRNDLSIDEADSMMNKIMNGELNNSQIAAYLIALKSKGEVASEVAGSVKAMRRNGIKIDLNCDALDMCGTGGDGSNTFNISTASSFVAAAGGLKIAKHGNRAISSKSGSADVLKELGVNIELTPEQSKEAIERIGISFLFAPLYHPSMKYAGPIRKELAMKTIFNVLGPLTNPANTKKQVIGTFSNKNASLMIEAAKDLDYENIILLCSEDKYDEVTLTGETMVYQYSKNDGIKSFKILPSDFGTDKVNINDLAGKDSRYNAELIKNIFNRNSDSAAARVIAANSAMAFYVNGYSTNLKKCFNFAMDLIKSGETKKKLNELIDFGANL